MRRRDFIKRSAMALAAVPLLNQQGVVNDSVDKALETREELPEGLIDNENVKRIFEELNRYDVKQAHFYMNNERLLNIGSENDKISRLFDDYQQGYHFKYFHNDQVHHFGKQAEMDNNEIERLVNSLRKSKSESFQKPSQKGDQQKENDSTAIKDSVSTGDSTAVKDSTAKDSTANDTPFMFEDDEDLNRRRLKWEEKTINRSIAVPPFPEDITLKERVDFIKRVISVKNRYFKGVKNFQFNWLEWEKDYGAWILNDYNVRDAFFSVSFEMICYFKRAPYRVNWGGMLDVRQDLLDLKNSVFDDRFLSLEEEIKEDGKLSVNGIEPDFYPLVLAPGSTAKLWGVCLFPFFREDRLYEMMKKDGGVKDFFKQFNLLDNPLSIKAPINRVFDDEGNEVKKHYLVQNGELGKSFVTLEDEWEGLGSGKEKGRSVISDIYGKPTLFPMYLEVEVRTDEPGDLKKANKNSVYVSELGDILFDKETGNFSAVIRRGYVLENGVKKSILIDAYWMDNIFEVIKKIKGIGNDLVIDNYLVNSYNNRRLNFSCGSPTMMLSESLVTLNERVVK